MQFRKHVTKIGTAVAGRGKLAAAAIIAVGLAVGGSVAADAAGSPSIPDGSIYHIDIHDGAVGSDTIANRSIQSYDMNKALVNALLAVPDGSVTEKDLDPALKAKVNQVGTGEPGKSYGCDGKVVDETHPANTCPGQPGQPGVSGYEVVAKEVVLPTGGADAVPVTVTAICPEGKVALGGGYKVDSPSSNVQVFYNMASGLTKKADGTWTTTGWDVKFQNPGAKTNVTAFVTCAQVS